MKTKDLFIALIMLVSVGMYAQDGKQEVDEQKEVVAQQKKERSQKQKEVAQEQRELNQKRREMNEKERGKAMAEKRENVRSMKIAFFTAELDLSSTEAEKFWPIYNQFEKEQFDLRNKRMEAHKEKMDDESLDKMTEKDATALLAEMDKMDTELFNSRRELNSKLKGILPSVKIIKLKKAEMDFNRKLLGHFRGRNAGMISTCPPPAKHKKYMKKDSKKLTPLSPSDSGPIPPLVPEPLMIYEE